MKDISLHLKHMSFSALFALFPVSRVVAQSSEVSQAHPKSLSPYASLATRSALILGGATKDNKNLKKMRSSSDAVGGIQQQAQQLALEWMEQQFPDRGSIQIKSVKHSANTKTTSNYGFDFEAGGFAIVSVSNDGMVVSAYSNEDVLSENQEENGFIDNLLENLAYPVKYHQDNPGNTSERRSRNTDANTIVAPLIQTTWGQGGGYYPYFTYNNYTPLTSNQQRSLVGCAAVAFGQVLNYYQYPIKGIGYRTYCSNGNPASDCSGGIIVEADFRTGYNWMAMPNQLNYNTSFEQIDAVSKLLYHIGVSLNARYDSHGAFAQIGNPTVFKGFKRSFKMTEVVKVNRVDYTDKQWEELIKSEISNERPVVLFGEDSQTGSGHAYILDGIDRNGYVHVNWGWSGKANGYYSLNALIVDKRYQWTNDLCAYIKFAPAMESVQKEYVFTLQPDEWRDVEVNLGSNELGFNTTEDITVDMNYDGQPAGDADLYIKKGSKITSSSDSSFTPIPGSSVETCYLKGRGKYYITLHGNAQSESPVRLKVTYKEYAEQDVAVIMPAASTMLSGESRCFTANVYGLANKSVTWSCEGGSIDQTGRFTAPPDSETTTCVVRATSVAEPTKYAEKTITVIRNVPTAGFVWRIVPDSTKISFLDTSTNVDGVITAWFWEFGDGTTPSNEQHPTHPFPASGTYTVKLTVTNNNKKTASISQNVIVPVPPVIDINVAISPTTLTTEPGWISQFNANVTGTANQEVTWSCSNGGSISNTGRFTAPSNLGTYTVTATSKADMSKSSSVTVTVIAPITISVSPAEPWIKPGATQQFTATVTGTANQGVIWSCQGGGQITQTGLYTSPNTTDGSDCVIVTSVVNPKKRFGTGITVSPITGCSIDPLTVSVQAGATQQFTAIVTGTPNNAVTWKCDRGTVSSTGLYTAPLVPGKDSVYVIPVEDINIVIGATVTVTSNGSGGTTN